MYVQFMKEVPSRRKLEMHISGNLYSAKVLGHVALPANVGDLVVAKSFVVIAHLIFYILDPIFLSVSNDVVVYANYTVYFYY